MRSKNLHELVLSASVKWESSVAFRHVYGGKVRQIKYDQLSRLTYLFASAFVKRGLVRGDRLILCSDNSPEWALACLAAFRLGVTVVPVDARSRQTDLEIIAEKVRPGLFLLGRTQFHLLGPSLDESKIAVLDEILDSVPDEAHLRPTVKFDPVPGDTPALIVFTSGTSGASKGVVLTHENILANVTALTERFDLDEKDRLLSVLPMSHMFEFTSGFIGPLVKGSTIVYSRIKGPDHLRELLRIECISVIIGVPAIYQNILKSIQSKLSSLPEAFASPNGVAQKLVAATTAVGGGAAAINRLLLQPLHKQLGGSIKFWAAGGAPVSRELVEGLAGVGIPLLAGYGLTEASPVVAANTRKFNRPGSAGKPLRNVEVRIVPLEAKSGEASPVGGTREHLGAANEAEFDSGEIWVRGPSVMAGYFEDDAATETVLEDGWLRTGDVGYLDKDGFLYVTGRIKSTIVTAGGYNIHPEELERALEMSPAIKEASVFGLPGTFGEQAYALLVPAKTHSDRADDHRFFQEEVSRCLADISEYKRLSGFEVYTGSLPRTRSRKVKRNEAAKLYQTLQEQKKNNSEGTTAHEWDADGVLVCEAVCAVLDPTQKNCKQPRDLLPSDVLSGDLGIDSFARLELAVRLEESFACHINDEAINDIQTVDEVLSLVKAQKNRGLTPPADNNGHKCKPADQYDSITDRYRSLDTPGHNMNRKMADSIQPWPHNARPSALSAETDPAYVDLVRHSLVVGLKVLLRIYNHMEVSGQQHLLAEPPFIVVANHTSHVDTAAIFASFPAERLSLLHPIAAADTFFVNRLSSLLSARLLNALPFDRFGDYDCGLEECEQLLRNKQVLILFPEGTRSTTGSPGVFRTGAARLAATVGCPIIPAHIDGAGEIMPKHAKFPMPGKLRICYGEPIYPSANASLKDVHALTQRVQDAVLALATAHCGK